MRTTIFAAILAICYIITTSSSCHKHHHGKTGCEGVACTAMFAMINTKVVDANGRAVVLDDAYSQRKTNGDIYRSQQPMMWYDSSYVVLDDGYLTKMQNMSDTFYFIGTKGGKEVVREPFAINADCCHVNKLSGKDVITAK
jgi:hypothetical protein